MPDLARVELWTDLEAAGGVRRAIVKGFTRLQESVSLDGDDTLTLEVLRDNPALVTLDTPPGTTNAQAGAVVRCLMSDGSIIERRLSVGTESDNAGDLKVSATARGMQHELSLRGLVARTLGDGTRAVHFTVVGLAPSQQVAAYVLPALAEGGQMFWELGTVHADTPVTVVYEKDTPLGALRKIAAATSAGLEVGVRYDPSRKKYLIDLVRQVGGNAAPVRVHAGMGLVSLALSASAEDLVTRVYGFGAEDDELGVATLGKNAWVLDRLQGQGGGLWTAQLLDPAGGPGPVAISGQYASDPAEGAHWLVPIGRSDATTYAITGADAITGTLSLSAVVTRAFAGAGFLYRIMRQWNDLAPHGSEGRELLYVQDPVAVAAYGARVGYADKPEAVGVLNHLKNPLARLWGDGASAPANVPVGWTTFNVTASKETVQWRSGGASLRAQFNSTDASVFLFDYVLRVTQGRLSFFADVQALAAKLAVKFYVTLQAQQTLPDGTQATRLIYPDDMARLAPGLSPVPTLETQNVGAWERLGMDAAHDALRYPVASVSVGVFPAKGLAAATGLIDAAQVTPTLTNRELIEGSGSNALLQAANDNLVRYAGLSHTLGVNVLDLTTMDDQRFPYGDYVLGGQIVVRDERLDRVAVARVTGWQRDWLAKEMIDVTISNAGARLTDLLAERAPSPRPPQAVGGIR